MVGIVGMVGMFGMVVNKTCLYRQKSKQPTPTRKRKWQSSRSVQSQQHHVKASKTSSASAWLANRTCDCWIMYFPTVYVLWIVALPTIWWPLLVASNRSPQAISWDGSAHRSVGHPDGTAWHGMAPPASFPGGHPHPWRQWPTASQLPTPRSAQRHQCDDCPNGYNVKWYKWRIILYKMHVLLNMLWISWLLVILVLCNHINIYINKYISIYMYINIYLYINMYLYIYMYIYYFVFVSLFVWLLTCLLNLLLTYLLTYMYKHIYMRVDICT